MRKNHRFAAKLLFQYNEIARGKPERKRKLCEERIINYQAADVDQAYNKAMQKGKWFETEYSNINGNLVQVEFIGLMELKDIEHECDSDEVWFELKHYMEPKKRKTKFLPKKKDLDAYKNK